MSSPTDRSNRYNYADGSRFEGKPASEIFTEIAENQLWEEQESISGPGSSLTQTGEIIRQLPAILAQFQIQTMLDAPCGDFNWMKEVDLGAVQYTGGDIVEKIVERNQARYAQPHRAFRVLDLMHDDLGTHDLLFCRDCLVHLSFADIQKVLSNLAKSNITWLMTTTFPNQHSNADIPTGGWRTLNFQIAPFHFPEPDFLLNEHCTEMDGIYADKSLGLWRIDRLKLR